MVHKNAPAGAAASPSTAAVATAPSATRKTAAVPISKRRRPWKAPRATPSRAGRHARGLQTSWEHKMAVKEKRQALMAVVRAAREEDDAAKTAERRRRYEKRKRKEENEMRSAKKVVVTNPKKLAKMSKKQFLAHVQKK